MSVRVEGKEGSPAVTGPESVSLPSGSPRFSRPDCTVDSECHYQHCLHTSAEPAEEEARCSPQTARGRRGEEAAVYAVSLQQN